MSGDHRFLKMRVDRLRVIVLPDIPRDVVVTHLLPQDPGFEEMNFLPIPIVCVCVLGGRGMAYDKTWTEGVGHSHNPEL